MARHLACVFYQQKPCRCSDLAVPYSDPLAYSAWIQPAHLNSNVQARWWLESTLSLLTFLHGLHSDACP